MIHISFDFSVNPIQLALYTIVVLGMAGALAYMTAWALLWLLGM